MTLYDLAPLVIIDTETQYITAMALVDKLMSLAWEDKAHFDKLTVNGSYLSDLAEHIETYETEKYPFPEEVQEIDSCV